MNIWNVIEVITSLFEIIIYYLFFKDYLGQEKDIRLSMQSFFVFFVLMCVINYFLPVPLLTLFFVILSLFALSFLFGGDIKAKIFATVLVVAFMIVSEMLALFGTMAFIKVDTGSALEEGVPRLLGMIISKTILLIISRIVCFYKKKTYTRMPVMYWIMLLTVPFFSVLTMHVIFILNQKVGYSNISILSLFSAMGLLCFNIIIFYLFENILDKSAIQTRNSLLEQQVDYQISQYNNLQASQTEMRKLRHDLKNHLLCILNYIKGIKIQDAVTYIEDIANITDTNKSDISTGNAVIDSLLNAKLIQAESNNIQFKKVIEIPSDIKIQPIDACVLFGNALDNAIEACNRITDGEKIIEMVLAFSNNKLIFKISNTTNRGLIKQGKYFLTSKGNKEYHGLGLENIESIVLKYKGTLNFESKDNIFELSFVI